MMTGRDLIVYILQNNLEDEPVFKNGKFIGFVTPEEVAIKHGVGTATVHAWMRMDKIESEAVLEGIYIPANYKSPLSELRQFHISAM